MPAPTHTLIDAIERQAASCAHIGSPLYASLLDGLAADHRAGGITAEVCEGVSDQPVHDAMPLRYLATAHLLALSGSAPTLAACYPSCGGEWNGTDITGVFLATVRAHRSEFDQGVRRNVQTNEVGRAAVLAAGFSTIVDRCGLPVRTFELGGSAGLLSHWDRYGYSTGEGHTGDTASPLQFGKEWYERPAPHLHASIVVEARATVDVAPIDVTTAAGRLSMLSFVWPDQLDRFQRLDRAIEIARAHPLTVDGDDAGAWLTTKLAADLPEGIATVVFHSIVWQYLPIGTKNAVRAALADAGQRATETSPVYWLRMEPATREHADLRLTTWTTPSSDGREEVLAHVGYHGAEVRWIS